MNTSKTICIITSILFLSTAYSETIFENFDTDPTARGWVNQSAGRTQFRYNYMGYLDVTLSEEAASPARYYIPLAIDRATSKGTEFWFEMDVQMLATTTDKRQAGHLGVLDTLTADNHHNVIGDRFPYQYYTSPQGNRNDIIGYNSAGTARYNNSAPVDPGIAYEQIVRVKGHYWPSSGAGKGFLAVYEVDPQTGSTGNLIMQSGNTNYDVILSTASVYFNAFGLTNRTDATYTTIVNCRVDNLYFSTVSANPNPVRPNFPPIEVFIDKLVVGTTANSVETKATIRHGSAFAQNLSVSQKIYAGTEVSGSPVYTITNGTTAVNSGQQVVVTVGASSLSPAPQAWSPVSPNLYTLVTEVSNGIEVLANKTVLIGFRSFAASGKNILLNGQPMFIRGLNRTPPGRVPAGISNNQSYIDAHIAKLKAMNVNLVRIQDANAEKWFTACDKAGLMVFAGCTTAGINGNTQQANQNLTELDAYVSRVAMHPCVVMWTVGQQWDPADAVLTSQLGSLYSGAKSLDPYRPVVLIDGGKNFGGTGSLSAQTASDLLDFRMFEGWYQGSLSEYVNRQTTQNYPVIALDSVGAYTNNDPADGGFQANEDTYIGNIERVTGHSYKYGPDSLSYQSFIAKEAVEALRRSRGTESSMCGNAVTTSTFFYDYTPYYFGGQAEGIESDKPVIAALTSAFEPVHASIECFNTNITAGTNISAKIYVLNDDLSRPTLDASTLAVSLVNSAGSSAWSASYPIAAVSYYGTAIQNVSIPTSGMSTGDYTINTRLSIGGTDISVNSLPVFIAQNTWARLSTAPSGLAVYDTTGATTAVLSAIGASATQISSLTNLSSFSTVIIGKDSFDATVKASEASILSFINSGKRVLVLEQNQQANFTAFGTSWLGVGSGLAAGSESTVNVERRESMSSANGLLKYWNSGTSTAVNRSVYSSYVQLTAASLDKTAVLANGGHHLKHAVVTEIFPNSGTGGSCIISMLSNVTKGGSDPVAARNLCDLVSYAASSKAHYQYAGPGRTIQLGSFRSEKGIFMAPLLQGMIAADSGSPLYAPSGRRFVGPQTSDALGELSQADSNAPRSVCPMYIRPNFAMGAVPVSVECYNPGMTELSYRIKINGTTSDWVAIGAGQRVTSDLAAPTLAAGSNVKFEIEADEGLIFYTIQLAEKLAGDLNNDSCVDLLDFSVLAGNWLYSD